VSDVLAGVLRIDPEWKSLPPNLHPRIRVLLERSLEKESKDRYQGIADARVDIQKALSDPSGVLVQPTGDVVQAPPRRMLPWVLAVVLSAVVGVAVWNFKPEPTKEPSRFVVSASPSAPVLLSGARPDLAISPNGRHIAYLISGETGSDLYLRSVDRLEGTLVASLATSPFFSPDGGWIGFSDLTRTWKKVSILGGPEVTICDQCQTFGASRGASWGPDDNIIIAGNVMNTGLVQVSATGGDPEVLTTPESGQDHLWPEILPNGTAVLFTVSSGTESQIAVLNLETREQRILIQGGSSPRYASTGHIVYGVEGTLRAVAFDTERLTVVGEPIPVLEGVVTNANGTAQYGISGDGSLVYISGSSSVGNRSLALQLNGTIELFNVPPKLYLSPRLSPDGQKVAVQTVEDEGNVIWVYNLSGDSAIRRLTFQGEGDNHRPIWTPDSQRVTFSSDRDGTMSIYWMPADGSGVAERLTSAEEGTSHWPGSWSPDGETLAYMIERNRANDWDIWSFSLEGQENRSLYDQPGRVYLGPEFSPDGRWLTYSSGETPGESEIYVEPFPPTGARWRVSQGGGIFPVWSRNGKAILFRPSVTSGGGATLKSVDIVTEPEVDWANEQTLPVRDFIVVSFYRAYDTSGDGQILIVVPAQQEEDDEQQPRQIVIVQNWLEELKERVPVP
jgi:Tol biopolymer transport system component